MPMIEADHQLIHYLAWGEAGFKPVLLLHGLTGCGAIWEHVAGKLAEAGFLVIAPDLRQHGHSGKSGEYSLQAYSSDIIGLIEKLSLPPGYLVGHSFGAAVAWETAVQRADWAEKLVIEDHHPEAAMSTLPYWQEWAASWPQQFPSRQAAISYLQQEKRSLAWWEPSLIPLSDGSWGWAFSTDAMVETIRLSYQQDHWQRLAAIQAPTLIVRGGSSTHLKQEVAERMTRVIPDCRMIVVPEADHWVHRNAETYVRALLRFFTK